MRCGRGSCLVERNSLLREGDSAVGVYWVAIFAVGKWGLVDRSSILGGFCFVVTVFLLRDNFFGGHFSKGLLIGKGGGLALQRGGFM